jgi:hypothetical protein
MGVLTPRLFTLARPGSIEKSDGRTVTIRSQGVW